MFSWDMKHVRVVRHARETLGRGVSVTDWDQVSLLMKICTHQGQAGNETHSLVASPPWSQAGSALLMLT